VRKLWRRLQRADRRTIDRLIAVAFIVGGELEVFFAQPDNALGLAGATAVAYSAFFWRRRWPVLAGAFMFAVWSFSNLVLGDLEPLQIPLIAVLFISYAMGAYTEGRWALAAPFVILIGMSIVVSTFADTEWGDYIFPTAFAIVAWLSGRGIRTRTRLTEELHEAAVQAQEAHEQEIARAAADERRRLAREMHDGVAQEMASLGYFVDTLVDQEPTGSERGRQLTMLRERLTMVVGEVRRSVQTLRTEIGENDSLGTAIGSLARHLTASSGIPIHVTLDELTTRLRPEIESELLRITQEAMTNAVRHSGATAINVTCRVAPPSAEIAVTDNGRGLGARREDSHGLEIMRERAALVDAELEVLDNAPHGTVVSVRLDGVGVSRRDEVVEADTLHA
jgi:signal transduction histidine kinase